MSDLFIASHLRPEVGGQIGCRSKKSLKKLLCPRPKPACPGDRIIKCKEKSVEKCKEKLFQEKLHDGKRCGEKFGDKIGKEKLGDKCRGEKLGDGKGCGEKLGDKRLGEKTKEKLGDGKGCGEKFADKRLGEKTNEKCGEKRFGEKLGDGKGCGEKLGDKRLGEKTGEKLGDKFREKCGESKLTKEKFGDKGSFPEKQKEKLCFEKCIEVISPCTPDPTGCIPSDRFFCKRG